MQQFFFRFSERLFSAGMFLLIICCLACTKEEARHEAVKTLRLKSRGEIAVLPDEASITIQLSCQDRNILQAKQCIQEKSAVLNSLLDRFAIAPDDRLTTAINQSKQYRWRSNSQVFDGYRMSTTTQLSIRQLNTLDSLYTALLQNENITISGLRYSHSRLDSLNQLAYQQALDKANQLADLLLLKMDKNEKKIIWISNTELPAAQPGYSDAAYDMDLVMEEAMVQTANRPVSMNLGQVYAYQTLYVEYSFD